MTMSEKYVKENFEQEELTCKPLDTYNEILLFLDDPPSWRSLCKELTPHSSLLIKNIEINDVYDDISLENPLTFCHFNPNTNNVKRHEEKKMTKTLICHDMANGYHDDSKIDGTGQYDAYTFYNWAGIDIFCYFSHHLITIPPVGWINVGHAHGVKVIGTVITEWGEGVEFWSKILESRTEWQNLASALVAIAKILNFDGWLLNVENKISKPEALLDFVRYLHKILHQELKDPVLIWYDSVTIEGHLTWQNGLNDKNKPFFDACDGIFTNYSWTENDVITSKEAAGDRLTDLYIGIDVWGRNFLGGGQFNVQQAIKIAYKHGCSLAIFAPAWTHEALGETDDKCSKNAIALSQDMTTYETFLLRDRALWGSIWPFLNTRVPCTLPFQTSFCRGQGKKRRIYGETLCPTPWYNLRHMQYQPNSSHGPHGYMLSTYENILKVSTNAVSKDSKGILKYREVFLVSRQMLHSVETVESTEKTRSGSLEALQAKEGRSDGLQSTVKRKMKNAFKYLLRFKSPKLQENTSVSEENQEPEVDTLQSETEVDASSTSQSMIQMSVNLNLGQIDKTRLTLACVPKELECLEVFLGDSFVGGSCLKVNPSDEIYRDPRHIRLFHCDFSCEDSLVVCMVTKTLIGNSRQYLNIHLSVKNESGNDTTVVLVGRDAPQPNAEVARSNVVKVYPLKVGSEFSDLQKYLLLNEPGFYVPVENHFGWNIWYYQVKLSKSSISTISCQAGLARGPLLLGHLGLCHRRIQV